MKDLEDFYAHTPLSDIPWNRSEMPNLLDTLINKYLNESCKAIDLGCGAGNYSVELALRGFDITGVDSSKSAIGHARTLAHNRKVVCNFICSDLLELSFGNSDKFGFAFDWLVLHHIYPQHRRKYLNKVYELLEPGALYISVCFSDQSKSFGGSGKYRPTPIGTKLYFSSKKELRRIFSALFEVIELEEAILPATPNEHIINYAVLKKPHKSR